MYFQRTKLKFPGAEMLLVSEFKVLNGNILKLFDYLISKHISCM